MPLTTLILMLKINLWMQCRVPQIKLKVLQSKSSSSSCSPSSSSRSGSSRSCKQQCSSWSKCTMQPPQQLALAQPVPTGLVVPAPQVFYQNWIGKKPEFSGKPEEDAESHLFSTRDWMEAHNFPVRSKLDIFA